jgi:hypothetical protein
LKEVLRSDADTNFNATQEPRRSRHPSLAYSHAERNVASNHDS